VSTPETATRPLNAQGLTGNQSVPIDSVIVFRHPAVGEDLRVRSGAHAIQWSYELNTVSTPTVGGEVVQVLSCLVGPITIRGEAAGYQTGPKPDRSKRPGWEGFTPADEFEEIRSWFLRYMHAAGSLQGDDDQRDQAAIRFSYPARGWDFWIQVTSLQGFDFSADQVAVPWSITAEVMSDAGLDYFEAATMNSFTDDLTSRTLLAQAISPGKDAGSNPFINPALNDPGASDLATRLGDNFQSLIASWAGANFMTWGFNPLGDPADVLAEDPYSQWSKLLGGEYLGEMPEGAITDYAGAQFVAVDGGVAKGSTVEGATTGVEQWVTDVLRGLAAPQTQQNVCFLKSWAFHEDNRGPGATNPPQAAKRFNWLNTTQPAPGSTDVMSNGVKGYPNHEVGVQATVSTITNGHYPDIVAGLRTGNILQADRYAAIQDDLNTWGTGAHWASIRTMSNKCVASAQAAGPVSAGPIFKVNGSTAYGPPTWAGSKEIADRLRALAPQLTVVSSKRDTQNTKSNNVSDHWNGMLYGYAYDLSDGGSPTPGMDQAARDIMAALGVNYDGRSELVENVTKNGYRVQVLYRTNVGGNHFNHVHVGVRKVA
jgi:hypothetical protein